MPTDGSALDRSDALHKQVARHIRNDIDAGVLRDGEVLPSTRELAQRWDVSVFTITEAMKLLAEEGLVVSKSRSKRVVQAPDQPREKLRPPAPHMVLIGGYAGSGKSELGRILARETGWAILDKDTMTRPVVEAALEVLGLSPNDRESEAYHNLIRPREYEGLMAAAHENAASGASAVVAAPFIKEFRDAAWVERTHASFTAVGATVTLVWVYCDAESMQMYIRHRGAARDAAKLADWPSYLNTIDVDFRPAEPYVLVDNCASGLPLQRQARDLVAALVSREPV
ncbi:GntR family transcriptional regulator [Luedemannella helvata]|uniref:HTH gntR-type domain-containing protein n=1 Tax=Luedemannella helvata TaxID=349315 RepID=A0ABN2L7Y7_9ACTN